VKIHETDAHHVRTPRGTGVANSSIHWGGHAMLMFKRSQLYLGLALAGLFEIIVRVVVH